MANGVAVQFAVLSVSAMILICALILYKRSKGRPAPPIEVPPARPVVIRPMPAKVAQESAEAEPRPTQTPAMEREAVSSPPVVPKPAVVIAMAAAVTTREERNERILAGISENIKKSLQLRAVPQHSPIPYNEAKPRNTEYVRVKKEIITPHGQIRFSILKDWMSTNMLAVFRRATLDWKTPDDLIAFLPGYLEAEAEILNNQVLLIGTPGHNEKLAVPIRNLDDGSALYGCFDFVADSRVVINTPAVLLPLDAEFEVVSRGVIAHGAFTTAVEQGQTDVKRLGEKYSAALSRMEPAEI